MENLDSGRLTFLHRKDLYNFDIIIIDKYTIANTLFYTFDFYLGVKVLQNVAQYHLHHPFHVYTCKV